MPAPALLPVAHAVVLVESDGGDDAHSGSGHRLRQSFSAMTGDDVSDLVPDDGGELGVVSGVTNAARIYL